MSGHVVSCLQPLRVGQPFVIFQTISTVDNSAHEFVTLSAFAGHLTKDLLPKIPSRLLEKSEQGQQ